MYFGIDLEEAFVGSMNESGEHGTVGVELSIFTLAVGDEL